MKRLFRLPFSRDGVRRDVDAEVDFHLQGRIDELVAQGMPRPDAEREAARRFGDRAAVEAEVERIDVALNDRRALRERLDAVLRDARYAIRGLARRPLYAVAVVLTLALAIGANAAIFSMVEAVLLKPVDVPNIGQLAVVQGDYPKMNLRNTQISPLEVIDLSAHMEFFQSAAGISSEATTVLVGGEPTRVFGAPTMGSFFETFGVHPLYGKFYGAEESQPGRPHSIVLSYRFWQQLSGDPKIVGTSLELNGIPCEVVGIAPPAFAYPQNALYWRPFLLDSIWLNQETSRGSLAMNFVGRMRSGLTPEKLKLALRPELARWYAEYKHGLYKTMNYQLLTPSFVEFVAGQLKPVVIAMFVAVAFVLLIACANVGSLQLVRTAGRAREIAVRAALGAGRAAIARQLVVESAILAIAGGGIGIAVGKLALAALASLNVARFPALRNLHLDAPVLGFTAGVVVLAGVLFGTVPALRATRVDLNDALRDAGRSSTAGGKRNRFLQASVVLQNALTVVLLVASALMIRTFGRLLDTDPGFQPDHVVTFGISMPAQRYPSGDARIHFLTQLADRLAAVQGVQGVGYAAGVPFTGMAGSTPYMLPTVDRQEGEAERHANFAWVFGDYFRTMRIPIVRGRAFTPADGTTQPTPVVVDETLVKQSFGAADPIGVGIEHGPTGVILGVAHTVKLAALGEEPHPLVYHNYVPVAGGMSNLTAVVRTTLPTAVLMKTARAMIAERDPAMPVSDIKTLDQRVSESLGVQRFAMYVLSGFAIVSLFLALLGVYAVMSYVVSRRNKEIGIRVALGAQRSEIMGLVLREGLLLAATGLAVGAIGFLAVSRVMQSLIYGVSVTDPVALGAAVATLAVAALVACYLPARRAVRVDPLVALRAE